MTRRSGSRSARFLQDLARTLGARDRSSGHAPALAARTVLLSTTRRRLLQQLCRRPCRSLRSLAREIRLSPPTVRHHLLRLEGAGVVARLPLRSGRRAVFAPAGYVASAEADDLALLALPRAERILDLVRRTPLLGRKEIIRALAGNPRSVDRTLRTLRDRQLVTQVRDGPRARFRVGPNLPRIEDRFRANLRLFASRLRQIALDDGLEAPRPTVRRDTVLLTLGPPGRPIILPVAAVPETVVGRDFPLRPRPRR